MKEMTLELCTEIEDHYTRNAVDLTNMIRTPESRAKVASDVITSMPEKDIGLTYKGSEMKALEERTKALDEKLSTLIKRTNTVWKEQADTISAQKKNLETVEKKYEKHLAGGHATYFELVRQIQERAGKMGVALLGLTTLIQSAYISFELSRVPDTYANKAYTAAKNWISKF